MTTSRTGPVAAGVRVAYDELPPEVTAWVTRVLGSPVVAATTQLGGFSPGVAARLRCADGSRAFLKAVSAEANPDTPGLHRREAEVLDVLPADLPAPRLLAAYDEDPWVALLIDDVEGVQPTLPWRDEDLDRMLAVMRHVTRHDGVGVRPAHEHVTRWQGWARLAEDDQAPLDEWTRRNLDRLVGAEAGAAEACAGDRLVHLDVRADNLLFADAHTWLVDWPWAAMGAPWLDVVVSGVAAAMQGGPPPQELLTRSGLAVPADDEAVTAVVAAFAGMLTWLAGLPPPPGLPTVRAFQAAQATIATDWVRERTGWR